MSNTTRKLVISAMLIAFDVIFTRLLAVNILWVKLGFGFAAVGVCAMLYGPMWAGVTAAIADIIGSLLFPTGAYFPGFTATAAMTGIIFGLFLYHPRPNLGRCLSASVINALLVTLILNSLMIILIFEPASVRELLLLRAAEAGLMIIVQTAVLCAISASDTLYGKILEIREKNK